MGKIKWKCQGLIIYAEWALQAPSGLKWNTTMTTELGGQQNVVREGDPEFAYQRQKKTGTSQW